MEEVFPVLSGIVIGLAVHPIASRRLRSIILAVLSVAFGVTASWISGELAVSVFYILIDVAQVLVAAILTSVLVAAWRRRGLRLRS